MMRARRYEHPLTLLLMDIDDWPVLAAERGKRGALDHLSLLAVRIRRPLRDVDAIAQRVQMRSSKPRSPLLGIGRGRIVAAQYNGGREPADVPNGG